MEHLSLFKRRMGFPLPTSGGGAARPAGLALGPPGSLTLSATGNGNGTGRREGSRRGRIHVCVGGGGAGRRTGNSLPTPPPTSLSSNFCWTPSWAAGGFPIPVLPGQGCGEHWERRKRFNWVGLGEDAGGPQPTHSGAWQREGAPCLRPSRSHPEEKARGSRDFSQGDRQEGPVCSGVSPLPGLMGWARRTP